MLDFLKPKPRDTVIARKYFEDSDRKLIRVQLQLKEHGSVVVRRACSTWRVPATRTVRTCGQADCRYSLRPVRGS